MASQLNLNSFALEELKLKAAALPEFVDTTDATASASDILNGKTAYVDGEKITGNIATKTSSDLTASGATVTVPAGYYASQATKSVTTVSRANTTISATVNDTNDTIKYTASNNQSTGYVTGANKTATKTVTLTTSGATATMSDGTNSVSKSVTTATRANTTISTTADDTNDKLTLVASNNQSTGYVTGANKTATATITLTTTGPTATMSDGTKSVSRTVTVADRAPTTLMATTDAANGKITYTASNNQATGYVTGDNQTATKTITLTAQGPAVTASDGTFQVTKSVATATQATPSISISANGQITATATQPAGYVYAGTKTGTKTMTTQAAKTVTPTKSSQTAVAKNVYTTGVVTVAAIPDEYQDITTPLAELNAANGGTAATTIDAAVDNTEVRASDQEALIAQIAEALEGKAGGGSSGGAAETCAVTITQEWGMNDDPCLQYMSVFAYNIEGGENRLFHTEMTSSEDLEPQHSVSITVYKNSHIFVLGYTDYNGNYKTSTAATGGVISNPSSITIGDGPTMYLYMLTPTADTATFTFTTP